MNSLIGEHGVFRDGRNVGAVTISEEGLMTVLNCSCDMITGGVPRLAGVSGDEFVSIGVVAPDMGRLRLRKSFTKSALRALNLDDSTSFYLIFPGETLHDLKSPEEAPAVKLTLGARSVPPEQDAEPAPEPEPVPAPAPEPKQEKTKSAPPEIRREAENTNMPELTMPLSPPETPRKEGSAVIPELDAPVSPPAAPRADLEHGPELPDDDGPPPGADRGAGEWKPIRDPASLFSDGDIADACKNARGALTMERGGFLMLAIPVDAGEPFPMMPVFCFGTSETIGGNEYIVFKTKNGNLAV